MAGVTLTNAAIPGPFSFPFGHLRARRVAVRVRWAEGKGQHVHDHNGDK